MKRISWDAMQRVESLLPKAAEELDEVARVAQYEKPDPKPPSLELFVIAEHRGATGWWKVSECAPHAVVGHVAPAWGHSYDSALANFRLGVAHALRNGGRAAGRTRDERWADARKQAASALYVVADTIEK